VEHRASGDPGRGAARDELQRGGRRAPAEELPVGDDAPRERERDGCYGVVRGGRSAG